MESDDRKAPPVRWYTPTRVRNYNRLTCLFGETDPAEEKLAVIYGREEKIYRQLARSIVLDTTFDIWNKV